jgi:hypothetical protein
MGEAPLRRDGWIWNQRNRRPHVRPPGPNPPKTTQIIVTKRSHRGRKRDFRHLVRQYAEYGYELHDTVEGLEREMFDAGECPTFNPERPKQKAIVGTLRLTT